MEKIKETLKELCASYKLGTLISWQEVETPIKGFRKVTFNTFKKSNLSYYFRS